VLLHPGSGVDRVTKGGEVDHRVMPQKCRRRATVEPVEQRGEFCGGPTIAECSGAADISEQDRNIDLRWGSCAIGGFQSFDVNPLAAGSSAAVAYK
jgi:hypothetical protein